MPADTLLAPLTPDELWQLAGKLYRAFSRLVDAAEADLAGVDEWLPADPRGARLLARACSAMAAMDETRELHAAVSARMTELTRTGK